MSPTIYALSSGAPPAGVAVIRLSGPAAAKALEVLSGQPPQAHRRPSLRKLIDPRSGALIDEALALWFPKPHSFTGEDVVELQLHGGRAVIAALIDALGAIDGLRPAEAGEFTRRAFENNRIDLTQAEALADLIQAETEAQRRQALRQAQGGLSGLYEGWRRALIAAMALMEADIDFAEEEIPQDLVGQAKAESEALREAMRGHLDDQFRGERLREGVKIAILGAPNAGKSSILNTLARRDAAIVSEKEGTTRDVIEVHLDLGGLPVTVMDTAGLRESEDAIEMEGVRRAEAAAAHADLKLIIYDAAAAPLAPALAARIDERTMVLANKVDRLADKDRAAHIFQSAWPVSAKSGEGLADWLAALEKTVRDEYAPGEAPVITRARHRQAIEDAVAALDRAIDMADIDSVLAAEDLRLAARALGRLTGRVDVEDVLDVIFSEFCIGK